MRTPITFKSIPLLALLALPGILHAQKPKKVQVTFDDVKNKCDSLVPREQRTRVSVTRFNVTTTNNPPELGANMATTLESALQQMGCFNVLESMDNMSDMKQEIDARDNGYMKKGSSPKKGKMLGPQVVITGELTEYNEGSSGFGVGLVKTTTKTVHLGFILKILNPETREMLWSQPVNTDGKAGGSFGFGIGLPWVGRLNLASSIKDNPALMDALQKGIIQSCDLLADKVKTLDLPKPVDAGLTETTITARGVDFEGKSALINAIKAVPGVKNAEGEFEDGQAVITASHEGTTEDLATKLNAKVPGYKITGASNSKGTITLDKK